MVVRFRRARLIFSGPICNALRSATVGHAAPWPTGFAYGNLERIVTPLSADQVAKFWDSFHTFRDLALVGLMLLDGLRSCEALALQLPDLELTGLQMRVRGKGNSQRILPLPEEIRDVLEKYLLLERPQTNSSVLFVCLKGAHRGQPLTAAGLRALFRNHRRATQTLQANPHRLRHTFGADMVRDGISLPALQQLMGHVQIRTTMLDVRLAPQDVWREYRHAVAKRSRLDTSQSQMPSTTDKLEQIFQDDIQTLALLVASPNHPQLSRRRTPLPVLSPHDLPATTTPQPTPPGSASRWRMRS